MLKNKQDGTSWDRSVLLKMEDRLKTDSRSFHPHGILTSLLVYSLDFFYLFIFILSSSSSRSAVFHIN